MTFSKLLVAVVATSIIGAGIVWHPWARVAPSLPQLHVDGPVATEFTLSDLDGKQVRSSELKGRVVVLDLWATWCAPCIEDIPMFNRLQEKYGARGLTIVAAAMQSGWAQDIRPAVEKHHMRYRIAIGDERLAEAYPYIGLPVTYVISKDWKIAKKFVGTIPDQEGEKESEFEREIEKLLQAS